VIPGRDALCICASKTEFDGKKPDRFAVYLWALIMFGNTPCLPLIAVNVSVEFERFLELLGERIELRGWQKYRGGLDVKSKFSMS